MKRSRLPVLVLVSVLTLSTTWGTAQTRPRLADYFTEMPAVVIDPGYAPLFTSFTVTEDLNGDGNQDLVVLGADYPSSGLFNVPQPGRVFLGDGDGHFALAPTALFPVDTLMTVHPRKVLFADFNGDSRADMFISSHGWDAPPFPGEQNRLYLSRPGGGWRDATDTLPQISDFSHTSAAGDISGRGLIDIFVGNGYIPSRGLPYTLLNTGSGQFTQTRTNIPAGNNQLLDTFTTHNFAGATLTDLNGDGLPELIVTADSSQSLNRLRRTTILWNRAGQFVDTDTTELPAPGVFGNTHIDYDVQRIDINQDGLPDLVLVGTQALPYNGWFVQLLINKGNRQFVDETADRVPSGEASAGTEGVPTTAPWPFWSRVLDFNMDGAPDFYVEFASGSAGKLTQGQPLVWLNDGAGHFSTLKVGDFVAPGNEGRLGSPHLVATRNGYSFISYFTGSGGLLVTGLVASRPYRTAGPPSDLTASSSGSSVRLTWRPPAGGGATAYTIEAGSSPGASNLANFSTGTTATTFSAGDVAAGRYFVRVRATTSVSTSAPSNEAQLVVGSACGSAPGVPGTPSVAINSGGTVVLTWTAATGSAAAYIVEAGTAPGLSNLAVTDVGNVTTLTATGVARGTYYVRVRARNACGTGATSNEIIVNVQ